MIVSPLNHFWGALFVSMPPPNHCFPSRVAGNVRPTEGDR